MNARSSVYLEALGSDAQRLQPEVFAYIAGPPEGQAIGVGEGVFDIAGSHWGWIAPLLNLVIGPGLLVSRHEQNVPFDIVNRPFRMRGGAPALAAKRRFRFRNSTQTVVDVMFVGVAPGTIVNVPGQRRQIEMLLECSATSEGNLRLHSRASRIRLGRYRVRLPRVLSIQVEVEDGYDRERDRRTITATIRNPLLGTLMQYRGWFRYAYA